MNETHFVRSYSTFWGDRQQIMVLKSPHKSRYYSFLGLNVGYLVWGEKEQRTALLANPKAIYNKQSAINRKWTE